MSALTTNDVRVLRLLLARGAHSKVEIERALRRTRAGATVALRRVPSLFERGLIDRDPTPEGPASLFDISGEGARQLKRADEAAYGRWA